MRTVISEDGMVLRAQVLRGPKGPALEAALVETLREWRFEPARYEGGPVAVYMNLVLDIELSSSEKGGPKQSLSASWWRE